MAGVKARFDEISTVLGGRDQAGSLSVGLADLQPDDTLAALIDRADEALIKGRRDLAQARRLATGPAVDPVRR
jgi:PleD family two-component response regulator